MLAEAETFGQRRISRRQVGRDEDLVVSNSAACALAIGSGQQEISGTNRVCYTLPSKADQHSSTGNNRIANPFEERGILLVDSRSILTNKEKLKKFWEHKMEMEFKLRQQQNRSIDRSRE